MTFTVLRYGSTVVVDIPEVGMQPGFHAEDDIDIVRKQVQECDDMSDWDKICVLRELEQCETCDDIELELEWHRAGEATRQGLFVLCGACFLSAVVIGWALWVLF